MRDLLTNQKVDLSPQGHPPLKHTHTHTHTLFCPKNARFAIFMQFLAILSKIPPSPLADNDELFLWYG